MVIREENNNIVNAMFNVTNSVISEAEKIEKTNDKDIVDFRLVKKNIPGLGEPILANYYLRLIAAMKEKDPKFKPEGYVKPKPKSIFEFIDIEKLNDPKLLKYNIDLLDKGTLEPLAKKLMNMVRYYNNTNEEVKELIFDIKQAIPSLSRTNESIEDKFIIQEFEIIPTYDLVKEKGYLSPFGADRKSVNLKLLDISNILNNILGKVETKFDLEVNGYLQDDLKGLDEKFLAETVDVIKFVINGEVRKLRVNHINHLVVAMVYVLNEIRSGEGNAELKALHDLLVYYINILHRTYEADHLSNNITISLKLDDGKYTVVVYKDLFDKYVNPDNIPLRTFLGAVITTSEQFNKDTDIAYPITITYNKLVNNRFDYSKTYEDFRNSIILENKNKSKSMLVNLYLVKLPTLIKSIIETDNMSKLLNIIEAHLNRLSISELNDVSKVVRTIVRDIVLLHDVSFTIFYNAMNEALDILGTDITAQEAAGYAAFKLFLIYLAGQTYIV